MKREDDIYSAQNIRVCLHDNHSTTARLRRGKPHVKTALATSGHFAISRQPSVGPVLQQLSRSLWFPQQWPRRLSQTANGPRTLDSKDSCLQCNQHENMYSGCHFSEMRIVWFVSDESVREACCIHKHLIAHLFHVIHTFF